MALSSICDRWYLLSSKRLGPILGQGRAMQIYLGSNLSNPLNIFRLKNWELPK